MAKTLVIANPKGGVGRTTSVLNLGAILDARGLRVLLVDLDPQAGLTLAFGVQPGRHPGAYLLLTHELLQPGNVVLHVSNGLDLVPGGFDLAAVEAQYGSTTGAVTRLRRTLVALAPNYDYILIDTPPGLNLLAANGLVAADGLIIPLQAHYMAMHGVRGLLKVMQQVRQRLNPTLVLTGILATMVAPASRHSAEVIAELRAVFPSQTFQTMIPMSEALMEAPVLGLPVETYAPGDPAAVAYQALAEEIIAHE